MKIRTTITVRTFDGDKMGAMRIDLTDTYNMVTRKMNDRSEYMEVHPSSKSGNRLLIEKNLVSAVEEIEVVKTKKFEGVEE